MGTGARPYKRRNYFIKKGLQANFIIGFGLAVASGFILNMVLAYYLIDKELAEELYRIHLRIRTTSEIAGPILWKLGAVTIPAIFIVAAFVGYYLTRRVELPLNKFREAVARTSRSDFTHKLKNDPQTDLPELFNKMNRSLEGPFRSIKGSSRLIEAEAATLAGLLSSRPPGHELSRSIGNIKEARKAIRQELSKFKI